MPAELTSTRTGPSSSACSIAALIWSVLVTSTGAKIPPTSSARASPFSWLRSATTTLAPAAASWRATAAPIPDAPPVTMALAPLMSMRRSVVGRSGAPASRPFADEPIDRPRHPLRLLPGEQMAGATEHDRLRTPGRGELGLPLHGQHGVLVTGHHDRRHL